MVDFFAGPLLSFEMLNALFKSTRSSNRSRASYGLFCRRFFELFKATWRLFRFFIRLSFFFLKTARRESWIGCVEEDGW